MRDVLFSMLGLAVGVALLLGEHYWARLWPWKYKPKAPPPPKPRPIDRDEITERMFLRPPDVCPVENCRIAAPHSHTGALIQRLQDDADRRKKNT
jgi:hypothetical protein